MGESQKPQITFEQIDDLVVLRVFGAVTLVEMADVIQLYFSCVTRHLIWDFTDGDLYNLKPDDFRNLQYLAKKYLTHRESEGRTAFACPSDFVYGMFRMWTIFPDIMDLPYKYDVHRTFTESLKWIRCEVA